MLRKEKNVNFWPEIFLLKKNTRLQKMDDTTEILICVILVSITIGIFAMILRCIFTQHNEYTYKIYESIEMNRKREFRKGIDEALE